MTQAAVNPLKFLLHLQSWRSEQEKCKSIQQLHRATSPVFTQPPPTAPLSSFFAKADAKKIYRTLLFDCMNASANAMDSCSHYTKAQTKDEFCVCVSVSLCFHCFMAASSRCFFKCSSNNKASGMCGLCNSATLELRADVLALSLLMKSANVSLHNSLVWLHMGGCWKVRSCSNWMNPHT